jgi:hypothetical protein
VTGGDPAIPGPQRLVIGQRFPGQEGRDRWRQVIGPLQGQARKPERLQERPDEQGVLPHAVNLAEQQQASAIQRPPRRRQRRGLDHQVGIRDHELGNRPPESFE